MKTEAERKALRAKMEQLVDECGINGVIDALAEIALSKGSKFEDDDDLDRADAWYDFGSQINDALMTWAADFHAATVARERRER